MIVFASDAPTQDSARTLNSNLSLPQRASGEERSTPLGTHEGRRSRSLYHKSAINSRPLLSIPSRASSRRFAGFRISAPPTPGTTPAHQQRRNDLRAQRATVTDLFIPIIVTPLRFSRFDFYPAFTLIPLPISHFHQTPLRVP